MLKRFKVVLLLFLFWFLFFKSGQLLFLLFHFDQSFQLSLSDWLMIFIKSTKLDVSFASYILIFPILFYLVLPFKLERNTILKWYNIALLVVIILLLISDLQLYADWGYRLDISAFRFIDTPKAMIASIGWVTFVKQISIGLVWFLGGYYCLNKLFAKNQLVEKQSLTSRGLMLFLAAFLIIPIRGGVGNTPINISDVYFHSNSFVNHAAINVPWNLMYSITELKYENANQVAFMDDKAALQTFDSLYTSTHETRFVLNTASPNILVILLESFDARNIGKMGGNKANAPYLSELAESELFFSRFYASGDRTNRALVALLSGYPGIPTNSIIYSLKKSSQLPFLSQDLKSDGYNLAFYYGGDINFSQFNGYLRLGGFENIYSLQNTPTDITTRWGIPDGVVLTHALQKINETSTPFFNVILTQSSHTPYDFPGYKKKKADDEWQQYYNSIHYTDSCVKTFIEEAKKQPWWKNTLVVLMADHGIRINNEPRHYLPTLFNIPMIWTGGALALRDTVISTVCSQTDIAQTLLSQLNKEHSDRYLFSKNIFSTDVQSFAFYPFNNGFGFVSQDSCGIYDINYQGAIMESETEILNGKSYLQVLLNDYHGR